MSWLDVVILALTNYRLSLLVAQEDGPLDILIRFRVFAGVQHNEMGEPYGSNNFAEGLLCQWCNSVWIGIILTILYFYFGSGLIWGCLPLALSAFVVILSR